ncbi:Methyltransferase small domain protein [Snodgrassella alvi SCGC AB-598-O02]|nr:Methyltransferase small domain protein [Snodgrassella alvi SCGC AB-598-O02]
MTKKIIPASEQISQIGNGYLDRELGEAISTATAACLEHGKSAVVTVKLTISQHNHKDGTVKILADVSSKLPKEKIDGSIVFVTPDGNITNSDPKQQKLNLQTVTQNENQDDLQTVGTQKASLRLTVN